MVVVYLLLVYYFSSRTPPDFPPPPPPANESEYDEHGRKKWVPSETFLLVQEEVGLIQKEEVPGPAHSRTFKMLQQQLDRLGVTLICGEKKTGVVFTVVSMLDIYFASLNDICLNLGEAYKALILHHVRKDIVCFKESSKGICFDCLQDICCKDRKKFIFLGSKEIICFTEIVG